MVSRPVGRRPRQRRAHDVLVDGAVGAQRARDLDLVEPGEPGLHRAQRLLQRFREAPADRHRLADHFIEVESSGSAPENFSKVKRGIGDDVVDRRLERGRRHLGNLVPELVERVADRELRRILAIGKPVAFEASARSARRAGSSR